MVSRANNNSDSQMHIVGWLLGSVILYSASIRCGNSGLSVNNTVLWDAGECYSACANRTRVTALIGDNTGIYMRSWHATPLFVPDINIQWNIGIGTIQHVQGSGVVWANKTHTCTSDLKKSLFCVKTPVKSGLVFVPEDSVDGMFCYVDPAKSRHPCFDAAQMEVTRSKGVKF